MAQRQKITMASSSALILLACASLLGAQEGQPRITYAHVEPVLRQHCIACHSGASPADGVALDSYAHIMAGQRKHAVVVPRDPGKSELVRRVRGVSKPRMPANGPPWLNNAETTLIERWIQAGAPER
jgi:hypothetical protein